MNLLGRHAGDGDVAHVQVALLNLPRRYLRDGVVRIVLTHELHGERLGQKVVVEGILLRDGIPVQRVTIVRPIGEVGPHFSLAWAVVKVCVLDRLSAPHLVNADVPVDDGFMRKGNDAHK